MKSSKQRINIKKLHEDAFVPKYQTAGAACFDLHAVGIGGVSISEQAVLLKHGNSGAGCLAIHPSESRSFDTGLSFEIPEGFVMLIFSRSGHGFKNSIALTNCVGVIDSDYRGEVKVKLSCESKGQGLAVRNGDRIAQALIIPVSQWQFDVCEELSSTERGAGGFGSTGAA